MSLFGCGSIHQGHERFSDDSPGREEIFMCIAALLYEQFLPIREWRCQDIDQVLLHEDHFFLSSELLDKNASIRSKLPTAACCMVSGDNRGKFEANLLYVESESDFGATAGKSFTVFFARGGVEFDR